MPYQLKAEGYIDNQELTKAIKANQQARDLMRRILQERPARGLLFEILAELAHELGDELEALNAMKMIRLNRRAQYRRAQKSSAGAPPGAATDTR